MRTRPIAAEQARAIAVCSGAMVRQALWHERRTQGRAWKERFGEILASSVCALRLAHSDDGHNGRAAGGRAALCAVRRRIRTA